MEKSDAVGATHNINPLKEQVVQWTRESLLIWTSCFFKRSVAESVIKGFKDHSQVCRDKREGHLTDHS